MKMNLYPYNLWALAAMAALALVFVIMTLAKIHGLMKFIGLESSAVNHCAAKARTISERMSSRASNQKIDLSTMLSIAAILIAIAHDYREHDEHGVKQMKKSAENVLGKRVMQAQIRNQIMRHQ